MKRTLLITSYFPPRKGGISNFLFSIYQGINKDFFVLTDYPDRIENDNKIIYKSFHTKFILPKWFPLLFKTYNVVKEKKIELLQAGQIIPIGTVCYILKKIIGIKYHVYVYGNDLLVARDSIRKTKIIHKVLKNADKVIACSNYTKNLAINNGANRNSTIVVYPIPKNLKIRNFSEEEIINFKKQNYLLNKKIILTVGNLVKRKGQDMVIKSLNSLKKDNINYVYLIIGTGPNKGDLNKLIVKFGMKQSIRIIEDVSNDDLLLYYASCDLFIMPSRFLMNKQNKPIDVEGFGMVFLEANLFGKPIIGGNVGGQTDAIVNGVNGYIVDSESVDDIANKIKQILNNQELASQLGDSGKKRVLKSFIYDVELNKIKKIID